MSNKFQVKGLLGGDPELRYSNEGLAIASFNVADTPSKFNKETKQWENTGETAWFRVSVFGALGESVAAELKKGEQVYVEGTLTFRAWETKDGEKRESKEINANDVYKPLKRGRASGGSTGGAAASTPAVAADDSESPF